tara:strand:+ start:7068 stop:8816 length:1749 start_codon:yes stop_codon:yes gene_type:complete
MRLLINKFNGMAPSLSKRQLGDGYSANSVNARSGRGMLEPYFSSSLEATLQGSANSFSQYRNIWFSFEEITFVAKAPLKNDPWEYAIICDENSDPKITYNLIAENGAGPYPAASRPLGVPTPVAPTIIGVSTADNWHSDAATGGLMPEDEPLEDEYDASDVIYSIVYVDAWGRLSAPSPSTARSGIKEWQYVNTNKVEIALPVVADDSFISTDFSRSTTASIRIYRSNFSATGEAVFQYVNEVAFGTASYIDQAFSGDLQEPIISNGWLPPPTTDTSLYPNGTMEKIAIMGTETLVGHNKRIVCFAEPDTLHAWPVEYYKVFAEEIVTIQPAGASMVILTDGHPYVMQGSHPASMDAIRLADPVPCANKLAVTEVFDSVFFASPMGLYTITGFSIKNISAPFATEREWSALDPSTMVLANYDGKVFISCPTVGFTYMFDPANPSDALRKVDFAPTAFSQLESKNDLIYRGTDGELYKFDDPTTNEYRALDWESKTYSFPAAHSFNVIKVRANNYPVVVVVENERPDGTVRAATRTLTDELFGYLPTSLGSSKQWRVKVVAQNATSPITIRDIQLTQGPEELD